MKPFYFYVFLQLILASSQTSRAQLNQQTERAVIPLAVLDPQDYKEPLGFAAQADEAFKQLIRNEEQPSFGTGFITTIRGKKYIITNAHVIETGGVNGVSSFIGDEEVKLRRIGGDTFYDIAVLEFVDNRFAQKLSSLSFHPQALRLGEGVHTYAMPPNGPNYYSGNVSRLETYQMGISGRFAYVATSMNLVGGCSGSPLLNELGEVVGINSRRDKKFPQSYAIRGHLAKRVVEGLVKNGGRLQRAYLGLEFAQISNEDKANHHPVYPRNKVPMLEGVIAGSPADGLPQVKLCAESGYHVTQINQQEIKNLHNILDVMEQVSPRDIVTIQLTKYVEGLGYGKKEIKLRAGELTYSAYEDIARYFLAKHSPLHIDPDAKNLSLIGNFTPGSALRIRLLRGVSTRLHGQKSGTFDLVASGAENKFKYKVDQMHELGIMIRLTSMDGYIELFGFKDELMHGLKVNIFDSEHLKAKEDIKVLYY